jgi:hypothetical protein
MPLNVSRETLTLEDWAIGWAFRVVGTRKGLEDVLGERRTTPSVVRDYKEKSSNFGARRHPIRQLTSGISSSVSIIYHHKVQNLHQDELLEAMLTVNFSIEGPFNLFSFFDFFLNFASAAWSS